MRSTGISPVIWAQGRDHGARLRQRLFDLEIGNLSNFSRTTGSSFTTSEPTSAKPIISPPPGLTRLATCTKNSLPGVLNFTPRCQQRTRNRRPHQQPERKRAKRSAPPPQKTSEGFNHGWTPMDTDLAKRWRQKK